MALTKQERAFIEKETNLSIKDWENQLCSNEGMLLIQGKGSYRDQILLDGLNQLYKKKALESKPSPLPPSPLPENKQNKPNFNKEKKH
ncbi:hypothetical protein [Lactobacillus jensenii]|jgi:hypothetical protein|uniref:hypothetical protein n=1 Tax=Lactobacillus jensenii TaxID=109790 RepID=UPI0028ED5561|nr:hypothetical protein [Lactobacillus jensenii]MDT9619654.1 hypothetical protein [Lactobacillus jensenii]